MFFGYDDDDAGREIDDGVYCRFCDSAGSCFGSYHQAMAAARDPLIARQKEEEEEVLGPIYQCRYEPVLGICRLVDRGQLREFFLRKSLSCKQTRLG